MTQLFARCLLNFHYDAGRQGIDHVSSFVFHCFSLSVTCISCPLYNVLLELLFSKKEIVYILLNMPMFIGSQSFISQPSFMCVSAAVSELCESNQNKKKEKNSSEIGYFQFNTFPGHIIYPFFNQRYLLSTCMHSMC